MVALNASNACFVAPDEGCDGGVILDFVHLARYTMGDRGLESEILDLYSGTLIEACDALHAARDQKAWNDAAHTLKGSSRAVGATSIALLAEKADGLANPLDNSASRRDILTEIDEAATRVLTVISDFSKEPECA